MYGKCLYEEIFLQISIKKFFKPDKKRYFCAQ